MNLLTAQTLGPELVKLLGIPPHCLSFELRCAVGEIVSVKCEFHPRGDAGMAATIGTVLADYELVRRPSADTPPEHPSALIGFDAWMHQRTEAEHDAYMVRTSRMIASDRRKILQDAIYENVIRPYVREIAKLL